MDAQGGRGLKLRIYSVLTLWMTPNTAKRKKETYKKDLIILIGLVHVSRQKSLSKKNTFFISNSVAKVECQN